MGNYVFTTQTLVDAVRADADNEDSAHDMGGNIITGLVEAGGRFGLRLRLNRVPGATERDRGYWRDVGTIDAYYEAQMDLISVHPIFNLYNHEWPIHTSLGSLPPAKFVFDEDGRRGSAVDSLISAGVIISGAAVKRSILSPAWSCTRALRSRIQCYSTAWTSAGMRWSERPSSTRTSASHLVRRSAWIWSKIAPVASPCPKKVSWCSARAISFPAEAERAQRPSAPAASRLARPAFASDMTPQ